MTENPDFASRPQNPDAASAQPESPQAESRQSESAQAEFAQPAASTPEPAQPASTPAAPTAPGSGPAESQGGHTGGASPFARPVAGAEQGADGASASPQNTAAQPTATYPGYGSTHPTPAHPAATQTTATHPTAGYPTNTDTQQTFQYPRPEQPPADDRKKGPKTVPLVVAALAVGAIAGGASGAGIASLALTNARTETTVSTPSTVTVNAPEAATVITGAVAAAAPSTVTVFVNAEVGAGSGSGVVISDDGYIITNSHVVTLGGAVADPELQVQTYDGRLLDASIVGRDPIADLAVIQVEDPTGLVPAEFADSDDLNVGDTTVALGAPLGLTNSVSSGIISALNRSITVASSEVPGDIAPEDTPETVPPFDFWNFDIPGQEEEQPRAGSQRVSLPVIQTDAAINQGNSGGALVNERGQVIGINVAIASTGGQEGGSIGLGFAIPGNLAQRVAQELIENGEATHGLLGASVTDAATDPNANADVVGALIRDLTPGGAAQQAGLQVGDVVTGVNEVPITSSTDLTAQIRALAAGAEAEISFVRDGQARSVQVTLGALG